MIRQKSFASEGPKLYLTATPIGNLEEMSPRAVEVLKSADVIACEDTRTSGVLLKHFGIHKRLIAYQKFNEESSAQGIVKLLENGSTVAVISDAGYPCINDPGQTVVNAVIAAGYPVIPVSGPSAFLDGLIASGLVVQPFVFVGFLPQNGTERRKKLKQYAPYPMTLVFYEAPHRIDKMLADVLDIFGDRRAVIAREMTKVHEEFLRGTVSELLAVSADLKGEMAVIVEGCHETKEEVSLDEAVDMVLEKVKQGMKTKEAVKAIAAAAGIAKNRLYDAVNQVKEGGE